MAIGHNSWAKSRIDPGAGRLPQQVMHIKIFGFAQHVHLLSSFDVERIAAASGIEVVARYEWDESTARNFFVKEFSAGDMMSILRQALMHDVYDLTRWRDEDVIDAAAQRLCCGMWRVGYERIYRSRDGIQASTSAAMPVQERVAKLAPVRTAPPLPPPAKAVAAPAPAKVMPTEAEWTEDLDQATYAAVLRKAAVDGIPMIDCYSCWKAQRQRANG